MSKFFHGTVDTSESSESESEEEIQQQPRPGRVQAAPRPLQTLMSDSEEDSSKRIVKSAKDKRYFSLF